MLKKSELIQVIIAILLFEFIIFFPNNIDIRNILLILIPPIIILTNVITKRIAAPYYSIKIRHKIWEFQRFGFIEKSKLKKPFPIGLLFPIIISILTLGLIKMMVFLQFNYKNVPKTRILKKRGFHRFKEINESDLAFTAAWGFYSLLFIAIIGILIRAIFNLNFGTSLALYSIAYGLWNIFPISNLDGTKLFFGSPLTWIILIILYVLFLGLVIII